MNASRGGGRSGSGNDGNARARREDPVRTRPFRSWFGIFRPWERSSSSAGGSAAENGADGWTGVVDRAVEMGYRVIDEQIRQGQRAASEFSRQSYGPQSASRDMQELFVRSMRYYADMAALWIDFFSTLPGSLGAAGNPFAPPARPRGDAANGGPANGGPSGREQDDDERAVSIQLTGPAIVNLELQPGAQRRRLVVAALHCADGASPALTGVTFEPATEIAAAVLRVPIPEGQAPGLYSGVVFDERSAVRGTLTVQIES